MTSFRDVEFVEADFSGAKFRGVDFTNVTITDAWIRHVHISGHIDQLSVNGVDVAEYVERTLNERHPERLLLAASDVAGLRSTWQGIEEFAQATLDIAMKLPPERFIESVDGEWTYRETLRHLIYATDRWITGPVLSEAAPFHRIGMPNPPVDAVPSGLFDLDMSPSVDEVVGARRSRMDRVSDLLDQIDQSELERVVESPNGGATTVLNCLHVVFREEWWHNQYANRDLEVLASR